MLTGTCFWQVQLITFRYTGTTESIGSLKVSENTESDIWDNGWMLARPFIRSFAALYFWLQVRAKIKFSDFLSARANIVKPRFGTFIKHRHSKLLHTSAVTQAQSDSGSWTKGAVRSLTQLWSIPCHEQQDCISLKRCHEIFTKDNFVLGRLNSCESSSKLGEWGTKVPLGSNWVTRSDSCSEWPFRGHSPPLYCRESLQCWAWLS